MLTPYFEKSRLSASSRVRSGHYFACDRRVRSERVAETWPAGSTKYEKMYPRTSLSWRIHVQKLIKKHYCAVINELSVAMFLMRQ